MDSTGFAPAKASEQPRIAESRELVRWQQKLLPFTTKFVVVLAFVFFAFSMFDIWQVRSFVQGEHSTDIRAEVKSQIEKQTDIVLTPDQVIQRGLLLLEADALDKRYHQASALLMSRVWTKHLVFMTGMVLALLGATFILGKLNTPTSNISGEAMEWKLGISSSSPGIILSFLGTVLMAVSLVAETKIDVRDSPVYLSGRAVTPGVEGVPAPLVKAPAADASAIAPKDVTDLDIAPIVVGSPAPSVSGLQAPKVMGGSPRPSPTKK
jgi:hypothetical protein